MTEIDNAKIKFFGHVQIKDRDTQEILVDKFNAIHPENMSQALALSLSNKPTGHINLMVFGNGASTVSSTGDITYYSPNTVGTNAQLYNETYYKIVDNLSPANTDVPNNYMAMSHITNNTYSDIVITCTLETFEPSGQQAFDTSPSTSGRYVFDEIGLKTYNTIPDDGLLIGHVVFHSVQKSLNRTLSITYTIRIVMS